MNNQETFKVFQILLTSEEVAKVNAEGHGSVPKHSARSDMHFSDNPQTLAFDAMEKNSVDLYATVRSLYLQDRKKKIKNSNIKCLTPIICLQLN